MVRTYRYHATLPPVVVSTEAEDAALGPGWFARPDEALAAQPPAPPPDDVAVGDLEALGDLSAAASVAAIEAETDLETLTRWQAAELDKPKPRATVARALGERIDALRA